MTPKLEQKDLIKTHTPSVAAQRSQGIPLLSSGGNSRQGKAFCLRQKDFTADIPSL